MSEPRTLDAIKVEIVAEFGDDYLYSLLTEWVDAEKAAVLADLRAKVEALLVTGTYRPEVDEGDAAWNDALVHVLASLRAEDKP